MNSTAPILFEVNTRVWLTELSEKIGRTISLADVPESEISRWMNLGFTHIWLMGVWQVGAKARSFALAEWREKWRNEFPSQEQDVHGSPYAIQEYAVDSRLGQPLELLMLKERFGRAGLKLILDFVPNHMGLDSPEPLRYPARFVQTERELPGTYRCETRMGPRFFAHGRDPYFPPWMDTVQVDYRVAEAQEAMSLIAQTISMFGEGLRCDMAMLVLPDVFLDTWKEFPCAGAHPTTAHFWARTIPKIRLLQPDVELIAEVYWNREQELQDAGFDFTYNKRVTDFLLRGQDKDLAEFLVGCDLTYLRRSVHFLENHDEARVASLLSRERHKAAAALILFLPGMALLHDGQLEGRKTFAHIQMCRRAPEIVDEEIHRFYEELLQVLARTHIRSGVPRISSNGDKVIAVWWTGRDGGVDLGLVNLSREPSEFRFAQPMTWECLYSTVPGISLAAPDRVTIPPESGHILRRTRPGAD